MLVSLEFTVSAYSLHLVKVKITWFKCPKTEKKTIWKQRDFNGRFSAAILNFASVKKNLEGFTKI